MSFTKEKQTKIIANNFFLCQNIFVLLVIVACVTYLVKMLKARYAVFTRNTAMKQRKTRKTAQSKYDALTYFQSH